MEPQSGSRLPSTRRLHGTSLASVLLIVVVTTLVYSNSFRGAFVFDDFESIAGNLSIRRLWPLNRVLWPPCEHGETVGGRPLLNLTLALNYAIDGMHVRGYHAVNLALHVANALLLLAIVRRTLQVRRLRRRFGRVATPLALTVALLWSVHPPGNIVFCHPRGRRPPAARRLVLGRRGELPVGNGQQRNCGHRSAGGAAVRPDLPGRFVAAGMVAATTALRRPGRDVAAIGLPGGGDRFHRPAD